MTLFISFLLIYNFNMDWWWYGIATAIWMAHFAFGLRKRLGTRASEPLSIRHREPPDAVNETKRSGETLRIVNGPDQ